VATHWANLVIQGPLNRTDERNNSHHFSSQSLKSSNGAKQTGGVKTKPMNIDLNSIVQSFLSESTEFLNMVLMVD
jgi:hypothetical protein